MSTGLPLRCFCGLKRKRAAEQKLGIEPNEHHTIIFKVLSPVA